MLTNITYSSHYIVHGYIHLLPIWLPEEIEWMITNYYGIDLATQINQYYGMLQQNRDTNTIASNIRITVLLYGCPEDDLISESRPYDAQLPFILKRVPSIRNNDDTLRGKLWRWALGINTIDAAQYITLVERGESPSNYMKIRSDTTRMYSKSMEYNSRVNEESVIRVMNAYCHQYKAQYIAASVDIVGILLYVMPELDAFATFSVLMQQYFPTYACMEYESQFERCGAYAAAHIACEVIRICDKDIFLHLRSMHPAIYLLSVLMSFQTICEPFAEMIKLWDFLFCFGVHLNPVITAAQIIVNKEEIMSSTTTQLLSGLLSTRKWMKAQLDAKTVIQCTMDLILVLKKKENHKVWKQILLHASDLKVAVKIKTLFQQSQ